MEISKKKKKKCTARRTAFISIVATLDNGIFESLPLYSRDIVRVPSGNRGHGPTLRSVARVCVRSLSAVCTCCARVVRAA